jgi:hypothetical protein
MDLKSQLPTIAIIHCGRELKQSLIYKKSLISKLNNPADDSTTKS